MSALERSLATADALAYTTQTLFSVCATGVVELTAEQVAFGVEFGLDLPDATRISPPDGYVTETQDTQNCAKALPGFNGAQFDVAVYSEQVTNADGTVTTASEQAAIQLDTIRTKGVVNPVFQTAVLKGIEASGGQVAAVTFTSFGFILNFPTNGTDSGGSSNSDYIDGYYLPYWLWVLVGLSALLCCVVPLLVYLWTKRQDKKDASYMQKAYAGKEVPPGAASPQLQSPFPVSQEYLSRRSPYSLPSIRIPGTKKGSSVGSDPVKEPAVATRDVTNVPSPLGEASESAYSEDDQSQGSQSQFAHVRPSPLHPMSSWGGPLTKPSTVPLEQFVTLPSGSLRRFAGLESVMQTRSSYLSSAHQLSSMGSSSSFWSNRTPGDESAARSAMSAASVVSSATGDTPHSPLSPYVPNFRSPMSAMSALSGQSSGSSFDQTPASATRGLEHERSDAISSLSSSPQPNEADTAAAHSRRVRARAALAMLSAADAHRAHARATALAELTLHGGDGSEDDSRSQSEASGVDGALQGAAAARGARGSPHSSNLGGRSVRSLSRMLLRQAMAESDTDGSAGATGNASSGIALAGGASSDGSAARAMSRATLTSPSSGGGRSSRGTSLAEALAQLDGMHAGQQRSATGGSIPQSPTIDVTAANAAAAGGASGGALTASALAAADAAQKEKDRRGDGKAQSPSGVSTRSSLSRKQHRWRSETSSAVSSSSESGDDAV